MIHQHSRTDPLGELPPPRLPLALLNSRIYGHSCNPRLRNFFLPKKGPLVPTGQENGHCGSAEEKTLISGPCLCEQKRTRRWLPPHFPPSRSSCVQRLAKPIHMQNLSCRGIWRTEYLAFLPLQLPGRRGCGDIRKQGWRQVIGKWSGL